MARRALLACAAAFGYVFLYLPMAVVVAYSFNAGERVMVWNGFSLRWYASVLGGVPMTVALIVGIRWWMRGAARRRS